MGLLLCPDRDAWIKILTSLLDELAKSLTHLSVGFLKLVKSSDSVLSISCLLSGCSDPRGRKSCFMGWSMQDISGHILALPFPYLPYLCWGDIHLDFCWVPKRTSGRTRGSHGVGMKRGSPDKVSENQGGSLGSVAPMFWEEGTSSFSNYQRAISLFLLFFLGR